MMLSKPLQALEQRLREENRELLKPVGRWAPIAPIPEDPSTCRWCSRALRRLTEDGPGDHCDSGCSKNGSAPYIGQCFDGCGRSFETGKPGATLCHLCDLAEAKRIKDGFAVHPYRTYRFERTKRGGDRE